MKIEQLELEFRRRQYLSLYAAKCADEKGLDIRIEPAQRARNGETGIQMSAGASTGEKNSHPYMLSIANDGSVALPPTTFSRVLPIFTRIPVISIERTRFDLP